VSDVRGLHDGVCSLKFIASRFHPVRRWLRRTFLRLQQYRTANNRPSIKRHEVSVSAAYGNHISHACGLRVRVDHIVPDTDWVHVPTDTDWVHVPTDTKFRVSADPRFPSRALRVHLCTRHRGTDRLPSTRFVRTDLNSAYSTVSGAQSSSHYNRANC
jgi:hypothetical protein